MLIAISTHPESKLVERFGHDFPVLLLEMEAHQVRTSRVLEPQSGCCRTLAERLKGADVLICAGVGPGAARHLQDFGVAIALAPQGVAVEAALTSFMSQALRTGDVEPTRCSGHDPGHDDSGARDCGCGGHKD
jgi:predicted Fe-Mo cluster-binding NifX family protein